MKQSERRPRETEVQAAERAAAHGVKLLTYLNDPCIVIGRYQNEYQECNLATLAEKDITLVRRRSGGGAVYHDAGCMCFSIVTPRDLYRPQRSAEVVKRALNAVGVHNVTIGPRHDLWIDEKKICGSAFRITNEVCYHHGTLLLDSDLSALGSALRAPPSLIERMECKSVASVRSPVINIGDRYPISRNSRNEIHSAIAAEMMQEYFVKDGITPLEELHCDVTEASLLESDALEVAALEDLVHNGAPRVLFTLDVKKGGEGKEEEEVLITSHRGHIKSVHVDGVEGGELENYLIGVPFNVKAIAAALQGCGEGERLVAEMREVGF